MPLTARDFTAPADRLIEDLKKQFAPYEGKPAFVVSDVFDSEGSQYVNLVQKGGGVLGIGLVGYTYVLEKMGIRFLRVAGTSAGAINTALLVAAADDPNPDIAKRKSRSEQIIDILSVMNFFSFVDGPRAVRWLIRGFVQSANFPNRCSLILKTVGVLFLVLLAGSIISYALGSGITSALMITLVIYTLFIGSVIGYAVGILKRMKSKGLGLNPGDFFYDWLKTTLNEMGVTSKTILEQKAAEKPPLQVRPPHLNADGLTGDVTFITAELVTQNKIELPRMMNLFREANKLDELHPACYVRASMSIPIFFASFYIDDIPQDDPDVNQLWIDLLNQHSHPKCARFMDGGMLSNFPMSIFYNPAVRTPRLPSFGIDLDDSGPDSEDHNPVKWSFGDYIHNLFNTIRYYYDRDFFLKNKMFQKGVGKVDMYGFNWLNFFLTDKEKIRMFMAGADAAVKFLAKFDWNDYKGDRVKYHDELKKTQRPEPPETGGKEGG